MQDQFVGGWAREAHLPAEILASLRDLNHRFLDLAATCPGGWRSPGNAAASSALAGRLSPLSCAQRAAAANCPYALFDLHFDDEVHWLARLTNTPRWRIGEEAGADDGTVSFVRLALFYAWHVAASASLGAPVLLGMSRRTTAAFRNVTLDRLASLVATEVPHLTARWSSCFAYWSALTDAAARDDPSALRRVQLQGLQLAAAARLGLSLPAAACVGQ